MTAFQHATLCAPTVKTLINAINKKWLTTFPCLTAQNVRRHLPKSIQTTMGHLHRVRQGTRSTRPVGEKYTIEELMNEEQHDEHDIIPEPPRQRKQNEDKRDHYVGVDIVTSPEYLTGTISTDQTGRFPQTSQQGNAYIMIMYDYEPMLVCCHAS